MQFRSGSQTPSRAATTGARTVQLTPGSGKHRSLTQSIRIWLSVHRDSVSVARMLFLLCIVLLLIPLALYYLPNPTTAVVNADEANDSQVLVAIPDHMPEVVEDDALPAMLEEEEEKEEEKEANGEDIGIENEIGIENQALLPADADAEENRKSSTTTSTSRQSRSASIGKKLPASQAVGNWPSTTDAEALALVQNERRIAEVRREIALELIELWDRYIECACTEIMCADLVKTISCRGGSEGFNLALTLVDALDTLIIIYQTESLYLQSSQHLSLMSEAELAHMKQAIDYARNYVRDKLVIGANSKSAILKQDVSMFETTIRVVGGLLSAHYLTVHPIGGSAADQAEQQAQQEASTSVYLERCVELADKLMNAFPNKDDDPRMLPHATINLMKNTARNPSFSRGGALSTSEGASLQLEYVYLSALTGNPTYARNALSAQQFVVEAIAGEEAAPLLKQWIGMSEKRRGFTDAKTTIGSRVDSAYEYMVKVPLQLALHTRRAQVKRRLLNEEAEEEKEEKEEKEERKEPVEALNEHRAELEALRAKFKKAHGEDEHGKRNAYIRRLLKENTLTTFVQRVVPRFEKYLLARSTNDLLVFIERHGRGGDLGHHRVSTQFDHLNCFIVGTFAMAAEVETDPDIADKVKLAFACVIRMFMCVK